MFGLGVTQLKSESYTVFDFITFTHLRIHPEVNNKHIQLLVRFMSLEGG